MEAQTQGVDFAVSAWRENGQWCVEPLPRRSAAGLQTLVASLGAHNADAGAVGLVSYSGDVFLVLRVRDGRMRMVLSDAAVASEWPLAAEALAALQIEQSDEDAIVPVGDMSLLADLGMSTEEMTVLCDDVELFADEVIGAIVDRLGCATQFEAVLDRLG